MSRTRSVRTRGRAALNGILAVVLCLSVTWLVQAQSGLDGGGTSGSGNAAVHDPGVRTGTIDAGQPFGTLTGPEKDAFTDAKGRFQTVENISPNGLGPTFNSNSCSSCHSQPTTGGSSPNQNQFPYVGPNPQVAFVGEGNNTQPYFISSVGPVTEARFPFFVDANNNLTNVADGSVHDVFVISGMSGVSPNCNIAQPNFNLMQQLNNISFRIPSPVFGLGLVETITEEAIIANMKADSSVKSNLGIHGVPNRSGNDGTITRFGWKAQNKSGQLFAGEAYNVEMGITNELFPNERGNSAIQNASNDPPTACLLNPLPEDATNFGSAGLALLSDIVQFSHFMRFLNQPAQDISGIPGNPSQASINNGKATFEALHCNFCHTESLQTGVSSYDQNAPAHFLTNQTANLYSDLLIHHMGGLADGITQGLAQGDQFRTAPLWGLGQRIFFLHDGRAVTNGSGGGTGNGGLLTAIQDHALPLPANSPYPPSEATAVINTFNSYLTGTTAQQQDIQDLLNFLRSL